jgi:hypothetical protein
VRSATVASRIVRAVSQAGWLAASQARRPPAAPTAVAAYPTHCMHISRPSMPASAPVGWGREIHALAAAFLFATVAVAGCGSERTFTVSEFAEEVNEQGVEMRIGRQLQSSEANELHEITLPRLPGLPPPAPGEHEEEQAGERGVPGTLYVFDDAGAAEDQIAACRASGGLVCYRAENVVVLFEEAGIEAQRLALAIQRLAD